MPLRTIELSTAVPDDLAPELAAKIFFVSGDITDFRLLTRDGAVTAVEVRTTDGTSERALSEGLDRLVEEDILSSRSPVPRVVRESVADGPPRQGVYRELVERGIVAEVGEGQVALGSPLLELMDLLDARLCDVIARAGGVQRRYPTLIATQTLHRCGYFASFPQFVMFVTRLHTDSAGYRDFAEYAAGRDRLGPELLSRFGNADYCLPPTMCYHTFHEMEGRALTPGGQPVVVSSRGKSFRHESRYHRTLERLWDFTIREIVFLGDRDGVRKQREKFVEDILDLVVALGLGSRLVVANDPFFHGPKAGERIWSQRLLEMKYELRIDIEDGRDLAAGSFNLHEAFFGSTFGITVDGAQAAHTGCVGFGLERLAYAFVCRHGLDPAHWPDALYGKEGQ